MNLPRRFNSTIFLHCRAETSLWTQKSINSSYGNVGFCRPRELVERGVVFAAKLSSKCCDVDCERLRGILVGDGRARERWSTEFQLFTLNTPTTLSTINSRQLQPTTISAALLLSNQKTARIVIFFVGARDLRGDEQQQLTLCSSVVSRLVFLSLFFYFYFNFLFCFCAAEGSRWSSSALDALRRLVKESNT